MKISASHATPTIARLAFFFVIVLRSIFFFFHNSYAPRLQLSSIEVNNAIQYHTGTVLLYCFIAYASTSYDTINNDVLHVIRFIPFDSISFTILFDGCQNGKRFITLLMIPIIIMCHTGCHDT